MNWTISDISIVISCVAGIVTILAFVTNFFKKRDTLNASDDKRYTSGASINKEVKSSSSMDRALDRMTTAAVVGPAAYNLSKAVAGHLADKGHEGFNLSAHDLDLLAAKTEAAVHLAVAHLGSMELAAHALDAGHASLNVASDVHTNVATEAANHGVVGAIVHGASNLLG